jgi:hypothetical protein
MFVRFLTTALAALAIMATPVSASKDATHVKPKKVYTPKEGQKPIEVSAFCTNPEHAVKVFIAIARQDPAGYRALVEPKSKYACIDTTVAGSNEVILAYVEKVIAQVVVGGITFMMVQIRSISGKSVAYTWLASKNVDA